MPEVRIASFSVQDTLAIKLVSWEWDNAKNCLVIGGDNGQGKTSLCEAIWMALGGKPWQSMTIRAGAPESLIELVLADKSTGLPVLKVKVKTRRKEDGSEVRDLVVTNAEGLKYSSPQNVLDALISKFTFDPMAFVELDKKGQAKVLKEKIGFIEKEKDWKTKHDAILASLNNKKTEISILTSRNAGKKIDPELSETPVSVESIQAKLNEASAANKEHIEAKGIVEAKTAELATVRAEIALLEASLATKREVESKTLEEGKVANAKMKASPFVDVTPLQNELASVAETNEAIRANNQVKIDLAAYDKAEDERVALEHSRLASLELKEKLFNDCLKEANLPEGITVGEDELFYKDVPLAQVNTAELIKIGARIALMDNPDLKLLNIKNGDGLRPKAMEAMFEIAEELGAQMLIQQGCVPLEIEVGLKSPEILLVEGELA